MQDCVDHVLFLQHKTEQARSPMPNVLATSLALCATRPSAARTIEVGGNPSRDSVVITR